MHAAGAHERIAQAVAFPRSGDGELPAFKGKSLVIDTKIESPAGDKSDGQAFDAAPARTPGLVAGSVPAANGVQLGQHVGRQWFSRGAVPGERSQFQVLPLRRLVDEMSRVPMIAIR